MAKTPPLPQWQNLKVAAHLSCNIIRVALLRILELGNGPKKFIDSIAELLDAASRLSSTAHSEPAKQRWFIVRAFLWTFWQRCTMISFFNNLEPISFLQLENFPVLSSLFRKCRSVIQALRSLPTCVAGHSSSCAIIQYALG